MLNGLHEFYWYSIPSIFIMEFIAYIWIFGALDKYNLDFTLIRPIHKKNYVAVNIIKFVGLSSIVITFLYNYLFENYTTYNLFANIGAVYTMLDVLALIVVKNMQINTIIHHVVVQFLYLICFYYNFDLMYPIVSGIVIYTFFSSCSGIVNYFIALRVYNKKDEFMIELSKISYKIYGISCVLNWIFQIYFVMNMTTYIAIIYSLMLLMIINDDIILIKYLINYSKDEKE